MAKVHNTGQESWQWFVIGPDVPERPILFPICYIARQFIYAGSQNTKMVWLKQLLRYVERRYFTVVSGAQSVEIEFLEVVEGRCGVKGGR